MCRGLIFNYMTDEQMDGKILLCPRSILWSTKMEKYSGAEKRTVIRLCCFSIPKTREHDLDLQRTRADLTGYHVVSDRTQTDRTGRLVSVDRPVVMAMRGVIETDHRASVCFYLGNEMNENARTSYNYSII